MDSLPGSPHLRRSQVLTDHAKESFEDENVHQPIRARTQDDGMLPLGKVGGPRRMAGALGSNADPDRDEQIVLSLGLRGNATNW